MEKIKHFVLPENTNKLYKEESISPIGLAREVANKLNEIIDAYNNLSADDLEKKHELEGYIRKGVLFMKDNLVNSLQDLFKLLQESGELYEIIEDIYNTKVAEILDTVNSLNVIVTPEKYGAKGDGITDDTDAILNMIKDIEIELPTREFVGETACKDYSAIDFKFGGKYLISKPIVFDTTYGLKLENLKLTASPYFKGESLVILKNVTRNFKGNGMILNGSQVADNCLTIHDYTLTVDLTNNEFLHFKKYGLYADGKGHEIKAVNLNVHQYEWGEKDKLDPTANGTGIYLGADRHDNNFTNVIVNYCNRAGLEIYGGATNFINSHFYSCEIVNKGRYNVFDNCYFDNAPFKTDGFFTVSNSLLLKSGEDTTPFIYMGGTDENNWIYDTCVISNNNFKAESFVDNAIDLGEMTTLPKFTTIGNTFYYVTPFTSVGRLGHTRNPWDVAREEYGDETSGYKIYGNIAMVWGHATENGFQNYPNGLELAETLQISFERQDNANPNLIPWANTIRPNQFWANSIGNGSTVKWFVLGIVK